MIEPDNRPSPDPEDSGKLSAFEGFDPGFDPWAELKNDLLDRVPVAEQDEAAVDRFFEALKDLEAVWKAKEGPLDKETMRRSAETMRAVIDEVQAVNPQLSEALLRVHDEQVARMKADGERELREDTMAIVDSMRFGMIVESALQRLETMYPDLVFPHVEGGQALPDDVKEKLTEVVRPYYIPAYRDFLQTSPPEDTIEAFTNYFWNRDQSEIMSLLDEVKAVIDAANTANQ